MSPVIALTSSTKINLTLDILGYDKESEKHFVNTLLYRDDSLQDKLFLTRREDQKNRVLCDYPGVSKGKGNSVIMALDLIKETGWDVRIEKKIPIQAGLGGGSGNAAAILKYFGEKKRLPEDHLHDLAKEIGADVPFFLLDENLAYAEGFGDQIVQSWDIPTLPISIIQTGVKRSTAEAYAELNEKDLSAGSAKTEFLLQVINKKKNITVQDFKEYSHNDFEASFFKKFPKLKGRGSLCGSGGMMWDWRE